MDSDVHFEGVVVGIEQPDGIGEPCLLVNGRAGDYSGEFYIILDEKSYSEALRLGIGQQVGGKGRIISYKPLIIRKI
ncbi:MAG: hypothetical protein QW562_00775 [Thermosphaera sp.]